MSKHPIRKEDGLYVTVKLHLKFHLHSSPKETQLFWSCLSFEEECMSVNFEPNVISIMLPVTICQKPHSKIPHHSRTVRGHLSTSHCWNFTKLVASSKLERCLSFWEECMSENLGYPLVHITRGHWPWSRDTIKSPEIKVAFLLKKSVKLDGKIKWWINWRAAPKISPKSNCRWDLEQESYEKHA